MELRPPTSPLFVSTLQPLNLGQLRTFGSLPDGEAALRAMVSKPRETTARIGGVAPEDLDALVYELAGARNNKKEFDRLKLRIPAWVPAKFDKTERRSNETCIERQVIGHDFDGLDAPNWEVAVATIKGRLPGRFLAIHTTAKVRNEDGTWRIRAYELLDRPATPTEWIERVQPHMRAVGGDEKALDIARLFYLPLDTKGYEWAVVEGPRTPLESLLPELGTAAKTMGPAVFDHGSHSFTERSSPPSEGTAVPAAAQLLGNAWPPHDRHRAQLALAGALRRDGWTKNDALEFLCDVCRIAGDEDRPKRQKTIESTWTTKASLTGWASVGRYVGAGISKAARDLLGGSLSSVEEQENLDNFLDDLSEPNPPEPAPPPAAPIDVSADELPVRWGGWSDLPMPPTWLIDELISKNKINMIYAEPGSIKTWVAISMAIAVASGRPWIDERPVESGPVVYVDFEDGRDEFHRRVHMLAHGAEVQELGYLYGGVVGRLDEKEFWQKLGKLQKSRNVQLFVVDTLAAGTPGVDENNRIAADALIYAGQFTETTPSTVLILHHANKAGDIRGTSAFKASVDNLFRLEKTFEQNGEEHAKLSCVKSGQKKTKPIQLRLTDEGGVERLEEEPAVAEEKEKVDKRSYDDVRSEILLLIEKRGPFGSLDAIRAAVGARKSTVSAAMADLAGAGHIVKLPDGWVRDNERLRHERVREAILSDRHATKTKIMALTGISKEQFDRLYDLGHIRPASSDPSIPGFVWSEK